MGPLTQILEAALAAQRPLAIERFMPASSDRAQIDILSETTTPAVRLEFHSTT